MDTYIQDACIQKAITWWLLHWIHTCAAFKQAATSDFSLSSDELLSEICEK
jgi:hypothetical protein